MALPLIPPLLTNPGEAPLFEVKTIKNNKLKITSYTTLVVIEVLLRSNKPVRIDRYHSPSFIALPSLQIQQCRFIREPSGSIRRNPMSNSRTGFATSNRRVKPLPMGTASF